MPETPRLSLLMTPAEGPDAWVNNTFDGLAAGARYNPAHAPPYVMGAVEELGRAAGIPAGTVRVRFPGLRTADAMPLVCPIGGLDHVVRVVRWRDDWVEVAANTADGQVVAHPRFSLLLIRSAGKAYAHVQSPGRSHEVSGRHRQNPAGGSARVDRRREGEYWVSLPGHALTPGTVQVCVAGDTPGLAWLEGWDAQRAFVRTAGLDGRPRDLEFIVVHSAAPADMWLRWEAWDARSSAPDPAASRLRGSVIIQHTQLGRPLLRFDGVDARRFNVQATPIGLRPGLWTFDPPSVEVVRPVWHGDAPALAPEPTVAVRPGGPADAPAAAPDGGPAAARPSDRPADARPAQAGSEVPGLDFDRLQTADRAHVVRHPHRRPRDVGPYTNDLRAAVAQARAAHLRAREAHLRARDLQRAIDRGEAPGHARDAERLVSSAAAQREAARAAAVEALSRWSARDLLDECAGLAADIPIVLLPVRVQTRYGPTPDDPRHLLVRIYPDEIMAEAHDERLTTLEYLDGRAYWAMASGQPLPRDAGEHWRSGAPVPDGQTVPEARAWGVLAARHGAPRAIWIRRASADSADRGPNRPEGLSYPPEARCLPDRWIVVGYKRPAPEAAPAPVFIAAGRPIVDPLPMVADLGALGPDDALPIDDDARWTIDFERAVDAGMALRLSRDVVHWFRPKDEPPPGTDPTAWALEVDRRRVEGMSAEAWAEGLDRLIVVGVRGSSNPARARSELDRLLTSHLATEGLALVPQGTPTNHLRHQPSGYSSDPRPDREAFAEERRGARPDPRSEGGRLLGALGLDPDRFPDLARSPGPDDRQAARHMKAALWPATIGYFMRVMVGLPRGDDLVGLQRFFLDHVHAGGPYPVFRVGETPYGVLPVSSKTDRGGTPHGDDPGREALVDTIIEDLWARWLEASARLPRIRREGTAGYDPDQALLDLLAMESRAERIGVDDLQALETVEATGLAEPPVIERLRAERVVPRDHQPGASRTVAVGDVAPADLSPEREPIIGDLEGLRGLLRHLAARLATPDVTLAAFDPARLPPEARVTGVLGRLLLHSARLLAHTGSGLSPAELRPAVAAALAGPPGAAAPDSTTLIALGGEALQRIFLETLDLCGSRLDAWITGRAEARLAAQDAARGDRARYLGAYGWVEDLRPGGLSARGGYVLAPSMQHAATAAVLRNAHITGDAETRQATAIDLSSGQARIACELIEGLQQGVELGALLGARLERLLHDAGRDAWIAPLREVASRRAEPAPLPDEPDPIPGRIDGLTLWHRFRSIDGAEPIPWGRAVRLHPPLRAPRADEAGPYIEAMGAALDALADTLTAEAVFNIVRHNPEAAGAALAALDEGATPPTPQVTRSPRGGVAVTHRVILALDGAARPDGWPRTPRGVASPALDDWAAARFGPASGYTLRLIDAAGRALDCSAADLGLGPLDLVACAEPDAPGGGRTIVALAGGIARQAGLVAPWRVDADAEHGRARPLASLLTLAAAIRAVLGRARPLRPGDLARSEAPIPWDEAAAARALDEARRALDDLERSLPGALDHDPIGLAASYGAAPPAGDGPAAASAWRQSLLTELHDRAARARAHLGSAGAGPDDRVRAAEDALRALFGKGFAPATPVGEVPLLSAAIEPWSRRVSAERLDRWLCAASAGRPALEEWSRLRLIAEALGRADDAPWLAQLPIEAPAWVGDPLPIGPDGAPITPPAGAVGLVFVGGGPPRAPTHGLVIDEWSEAIPGARTRVGLTFNYDDVGAEAPQCVLLAVARTQPQWTLRHLLDILSDTLDLTRMRGVDLRWLPELGRLLPMTFVATSDDGVGVTTRLDGDEERG